MVSIYAGTRGYLDPIEVGAVGKFEEDLLRYMREFHSELLDAIREEGEISEENEGKLKSAVETFAKSFSE